MDMYTMPRLMSLKELCCQFVAVQFWRNSANRKFIYKRVNGPNKEASRTLTQWSSNLKIPKTLADDVRDAGIVLCQILSYLIYDYNERNKRWLKNISHTIDLRENLVFKAFGPAYDWAHMLTYSPSGPLTVDKIIQSILSHRDVDIVTKYKLAKHFCVYDADTSGSLEEYTGQLMATKDPSITILSNLIRYPDSFMEAVSTRHYWSVRYYWKIMDDIEKAAISNRIDDIVPIMRESMYEDKVHGLNEPHIINFLLDNVFCHNLDTFWRSYCISDDHNHLRMYVEFFFAHFSGPCENSIEKFLNRLPEGALNDVFFKLLAKILSEGELHLYQPFALCCHTWPNAFKQFFIDKWPEIEPLLVLSSECNFHYAALMLHQVKSLCVPIRTSLTPEGLAFILKTLMLRRECPNQLSDYLSFFAENDIRLLKRSAVSCKSFINQAIPYFHDPQYGKNTYEIVKWALESEHEAHVYFILHFKERILEQESSY